MTELLFTCSLVTCLGVLTPMGQNLFENFLKYLFKTLKTLGVEVLQTLPSSVSDSHVQEEEKVGGG